jgi:hypothetical protein
MTKRTFKASELVAMGLPDDPQETMSIVSDVLCGHKRWSVVHELTFRLPGQPEGEAWRVYYNVPATESQEEAPWGYEEGGTYDPDVTATLVRLAPCVHCGKPAEHRAGKDPVCWPPCAHYTAWLRAALADPDMAEGAAAALLDMAGAKVGVA